MPMRFTTKKLSKNQYGIYKNGRKIDEEVTKDKALGAISFYKTYYKKKKGGKLY